MQSRAFSLKQDGGVQQDALSGRSSESTWGAAAQGYGGLRGVGVGGVAGLGERRRFGGPADVTQEAADLSFVA